MNHDSSEHLPAVSGRGFVEPIAGLPPRISGPGGSGLHGTKPVQGGMSLALAWRAVRRWWKLALPLGILLAAGAGSAVWMRFEPSYRAAGWVRVKDRPDYVINPAGPDPHVIQNQLELLRSPVVLERVLARPTVGQLSVLKKQNAPLDWLQRMIVAKPLGSSEFVEVSLASPDPAQSATIVNAVLDEYLSVVRDDIEVNKQEVLKLLREQLENRKDEAERLRMNVRTLTKQATGIDPYAPNPVKVTVPQRTIQDTLRERVAVAEVEREVQEARVKDMEESQEKSPIEIPPDLVELRVNAEPMVIKLNDDLEAMRLQLKDLVSASSPSYQSGVQKFQDKIQATEKRLEQLRTDLSLKITKEMETTTAAHRKDALNELKSQLSNLEQSEKFYKEKLGKTTVEETQTQIQTGENTLSLVFAKSDLARAEAVYERISDRIWAIGTEKDAPDQIRVWKRAAAPVIPEEVAPYKGVGLACLVCLLCPFALALVWEKIIRRISDATQLSDEVSLPVVGEVAALPVRRLLGGRWAADRLKLGRFIYEESIDSLRTTIMLTEDLRDLKVLAVVSAVSQEGKSSVAAQLAVSLARSTNEPILVIDADMRSPDLHEIFEVANEPGLADVLDGRCATSVAILPTENGLLSVLPAGLLRKSPHALLGRGSLNSVLDELRSKYRYILIDTPPVLSASESLVFAKAADGALICTMREVSRGPQVRLTHDRLSAAGVATIGVVLSGVPTRHYAYKYGSYAYARS